MSKRRMIDRKIRASQSFASLSFRQRDLWHGIIVCADDQGRIPGTAAYIRSQVMPYDDVSLEDINQDLRILETLRYISLYIVEASQYIQIIKWWEYQNMQWAGRSDHPPAEGWIDRERYHTKGRKIITQNWDGPGGFVGVDKVNNYLDDYLVDKVDDYLDDKVATNLDDKKKEKVKVKKKVKKEEKKDPRPPITEMHVEEIKALPEIRTFMQATGRWPGTAQAEVIVTFLKANPIKAEDLKPYYQEWVARGYNPKSLAWMREWAKDGHIPSIKRDQDNGRKPKPAADQEANEAQIKADQDAVRAEFKRQEEAGEW